MTRFLIIFLFGFVALFNRQAAVSKSGDEPLTLKWNKAYPDDTVDRSALGLEWALSFMGAKLPNAPDGILVGSDRIVLYPEQLGFDKKALRQLLQLHKKIMLSEEYKQTQSIDMGRYVSLLLGSPEHYYRITGAEKHLDDVLKNYKLEPETGYVNNSDVAHEHRKIKYAAQDGFKQLFVASEVDSITGNVYEYETIEILPNGQFRFVVFDADGNRLNYADAAHTNAGKPAKCMWCHESNVQRLHRPQKMVSGFVPALELQQKLIGFNEELVKIRATLPGGVDFLQTQQHTLAELLYISFMEPSAERLSLEWQMPVVQVQALLVGQPTHVYPEFPFLGQLYDRNQIETLAPFKGLPVSSSVREKSEVEVNYID